MDVDGKGIERQGPADQFERLVVLAQDSRQPGGTVQHMGVAWRQFQRAPERRAGRRPIPVVVLLHRTELEVGIGQVRRQLQRTLRGLARALEALVDRREAEPRLRHVHPRKTGPCQRVVRVERQRLLEQRNRAVGVRLRHALTVELPLQVQLEGFRVVAAPERRLVHVGRGGRAGGRLGWRAQQRHAQLLDHRLRDVVLHGEDIVEFAVVGFRPEVRIRGHLDQLRGDAHALAGPADAAFEHRRHVERLRDRRDVDVLALERERRRARRDAQAADLGQHVQQFLRQPVGEVLVLLVAAHVDERQHGDRWGFARGGRGGCGGRRDSRATGTDARGAGGTAAALPVSTRRTRSAKACGASPPGRCVHCTSRNFSGTRALASSVASMTTGSRKALSSAMSSVRLAARFHSRRK